MNRYRLDGHTPIPAPDLEAWGAWYETADEERRVAITRWHPLDVSVSTVFLGLDHNFGGGPPILFETMVFGTALDGEGTRYYTWEEAERGHAAWVERVRVVLGTEPDEVQP